MIVVVGDYVPDKSPVYKSNATVVAAAYQKKIIIGNNFVRKSDPLDLSPVIRLLWDAQDGYLY